MARAIVPDDHPYRPVSQLSTETTETLIQKLARLEPVIEELAALPETERRRRMFALDLDDLEFLAGLSIFARFVRKGT